MPDNVATKDDIARLKGETDVQLGRIWSELRKLNTAESRRAAMNGALLILGSAIGSGIVNALQHMRG
ncbi:hypothetical protein AA23498_3314 [Acetobacter nitrogenifigens DSM 23921 = NBRC 105050]|uniref:Uncharacterized protein n=1 Tax=Acetobacter nitrogenifigens DSM 23921 = NBRC 105050 TaxID=1120919 RepID=A0A511XFL9_9PROT|nr:hypothetical protein [Acetobacter nitrogenifigens]GBQ98780.1 hypothetical protein AA23498_3314 [Acetobacter nitrogenifigens DSM 23921 = NBRC 105050]GEN61744.1 hypothetical protein ANI02nite_36280 [Acetobacter nitrogenifigens DSM 23921 = NBRC 105050]